MGRRGVTFGKIRGFSTTSNKLLTLSPAVAHHGHHMVNKGITSAVPQRSKKI